MRPEPERTVIRTPFSRTRGPPNRLRPCAFRPPLQGPTMTDARRNQRREIRILQREATWLQKALFALGKASESRDKLDGSDDTDEAPYMVALEGGDIPLEDVEDALEARVKVLLDMVRERRRTLR